MRIVSIVSVHFCFRHPVFFGTGRTVPHRVLLDLFEQIFEISYADRRGSHFFSRFFLVFCRTWNTRRTIAFISFTVTTPTSVKARRRLLNRKAEVTTATSACVCSPISVRLLGLLYGCRWHVGAPPLSDSTVWLCGSPCPEIELQVSFRLSIF